MTRTRLAFVCESAPGFARLAAAVVNDRCGTRTTAVGGPARSAGFLDERVAHLATRFEYDVSIGRVPPLDSATIREADHVIAMGDVPNWVSNGPHVERWEGSFPAATEPKRARSTVERIERDVDALLDDHVSTPEAAGAVSSASSSD